MNSFLCCVIAYACFCFGSIAAQMMPPQPMPMPGMGMGGPNMFNPFTGPVNVPSRNMNNNRFNNNDNANHNDKANHNNNSSAIHDKNDHKPNEQSRTDNMLDNMGLHGIQDFYSALTNELARNPSGFQGNAGGGAPQDAMGYRKK
jgi:hypothetical protein